MSNNNKTIQKNRMMTYFINAADEILSSDKNEPLTARKVADSAGYNVATLYNYFNNLNHLILYTSVKYLHAYANDLSLLHKHNLSPVDFYLKSWELFCKHSFKYPDKFHSIFFGEFNHEIVEETIKTCSEIFSNSDNNTVKLMPLLKLSNIYERDNLILSNIVSKNPNLDNNDIANISEMIILIYQSMLYNFMVKRSNDSFEEGIHKMMCYIRQVLHSYELI
ncbi:TetR/AcrR family transcriptional regulator [Terrisporobacter glycolicus]|uniref:HTH tetR-type domain-containing protein n=1 Tax=Terrisporobacter glycolicus ATCC 14880 = DSM 1288 TaxID=1121315 RepID=A0ABZ2EWM4_9FIRM|nr:TetR/AcrR family transcriptional regulator [Terrisporobacter glycolicus]